MAQFPAGRAGLWVGGGGRRGGGDGRGGGGNPETHRGALSGWGIIWLYHDTITSGPREISASDLTSQAALVGLVNHNIQYPPCVYL